MDNTQRELHGALLDAEILADVYLIMTSGQSNLSLKEDSVEIVSGGAFKRELDPQRPRLRVIKANEAELQSHEARLEELEEKGVEGALWNRL